MLLFQWSRWPFELWCGTLGAIFATLILVPTGYYFHWVKMKEAKAREADAVLREQGSKEFADYLMDEDENWRKTVLLLLGSEPTDVNSRRDLATFIQRVADRPGLTDEERAKLRAKAKQLEPEP